MTNDELQKIVTIHKEYFDLPKERKIRGLILLSQWVDDELKKNEVSQVVEENKRFTLERLHKIITTPDRTNGFELHVKHLWDHNSVKGIFRMTGLDVSHLIGDKPDTSGVRIQNPTEKGPIEFV